MICFAVSHFVEVVTFSLKVQKKMICRETARKQTGLDDRWLQLDVDKTGAWAAGDYKHVCIVTCHQVKKKHKKIHTTKNRTQQAKFSLQQGSSEKEILLTDRKSLLK